MSIQDIRVIDKEGILKEILEDFFKTEEIDHLMVAFLDKLQEDFMKITDSFAKFVERRYDILNCAPEFDFMDALSRMLDGYYSLKSSYLKDHYEMLMKSAKEGKAQNEL